MDKTKQRETLCFSCRCPLLECEWMHSAQPVDGWTADEFELWTGYHQVKSYLVRECPKYRGEK